MATTLTAAQRRVIELLAKTPRPNIYFTAKQQWKACISPMEIFSEEEIDLLGAAKLIEGYCPTIISRRHLRLTPAGLTYARENGMVTDGE